MATGEEGTSGGTANPVDVTYATRDEILQILGEFKTELKKNLSHDFAQQRRYTRDLLKNVSPQAGEMEREETDTFSKSRDATGATQVDLKAFRELARLEAKLGDEVIASLGDDYESMPMAQQAMVLRALTKSKGPTAGPQVKVAEPATAGNPKPKQTSRAEAPASRDGPPLPKTKRELAAFQKEHPLKAKEMILNEEIDPMSMPW